MLGDDRLTSGGTGLSRMGESYVGRCSLFCQTHPSLALQALVDEGLGAGYNIVEKSKLENRLNLALRRPSKRMTQTDIQSL